MRCLSLLACLLLLAACSDVRTYDARGRVISIADDARSIVVDHEDIRGLMPAMTMPFTVDDPSEIDGIAEGDAIGFRLNVTDDRSWIDRVRLLDPSAVEGRPSQPVVSEDSDVRLMMPGETVPEFTLVDSDGSLLTDDDLRGRPYLITFIYTRCPIPDYCPLMARRFAEIQAELNERAVDLELISVSIDPEYDSPEVMSDYAERLNADQSNWRFATGSPAQVSRAATIFGVFYNEADGGINHNLSTVLVDSEGRVRRIWRGNEWAVDEVVGAAERVVSAEKVRFTTGS
jgi:protein SCO1